MALHVALHAGRRQRVHRRIEVRETRTELAETVEALAEKADVKGRAREKIDDRKQALRESVHDAADAAREIRDHFRHKG